MNGESKSTQRFHHESDNHTHSCRLGGFDEECNNYDDGLATAGVPVKITQHDCGCNSLHFVIE